MVQHCWYTSSVAVLIKILLAMMTNYFSAVPTLQITISQISFSGTRSLIEEMDDYASLCPPISQLTEKRQTDLAQKQLFQ